MLLEPELKFVAIFPLANQMNGVRNMTVNTLTAGPTLVWHYIESPDGQFYYPLFATAEEANFVDEQYGTAAAGAGASHEHIFPDEQPSVNTWYMPNTYMHHAQTSAPTLAGVTYNEISTGADDAHAPTTLGISNQIFTENASVNLQIVPADSEPATITGLPSGLVYSNNFITGTTPYVPFNKTYTVTVVRSNSYGSTSETFTITIQDNASLGNIAGFTETQGNFVQPNRIILDYDALLQYDTQLNPGEELTYSYSQIPPTIGILNASGQTNLTAFDPTTDILGTTNNANNFAQTNQWALRYVSFGGDVGSGPEKFNLVGWVNNSVINGSEGTNTNAVFKLEYSNTDGLIRLYRNNALLLTSASAFVGAQTLTFAAFNDQQQSDVYIPTNLTITNSAAGTTTPPSGFTDPLEEGVMNTQTLMGNGTDSAVVTITQTLAINHRYIIPQTWIEANVLPYIAGSAASSSNDKQWLFGVPKTGVNWDTVDVNHFHATFRIEGTSSGNLSRVFFNNSSNNATLISSPTDAYYDYGLEWDGTTLYLIRCTTNDMNTTPSIADGGTFASVQWFNLTAFAGQPLTLAMAVRNGGQVNLTTSGLNHIRTPYGAQTILVGEASGGGSQFALQPSATMFDTAPNGHAPSSFPYTAPTVNAGSTYKFIYHPSMEATDAIKFTRIDDGTDYTTGVTFFGNINADPGFTNAYKGVTFAIPADAPPLNVGYKNSYQGNNNYAPKPLPISGSTYVAPVTGVAIEGPTANFTGNVINSGSNGWLSLNEQLSPGERLVLDSAFIQDLNNALPDHCIFWIGLKDATWTNTSSPTGSFYGGATVRFYNTSASSSGGAYGPEDGLRIFSYAGGGTSATQSYVSAAGLANSSAFLEITSSGDNIRVGFSNGGANAANGGAVDDANSTAYADWTSGKKVKSNGLDGTITGPKDVMVYWYALTPANTVGFDISDLDWTGLSEISVPTVPAALTTAWTKALDFSGSAERTQQVDNNYFRCPIMMGSTGQTVSAPTAGQTTSTGHPWATTCVFQIDGNSSNQHIWNLGEGAGNTDDNIYLRIDSVGRLFFGWGRPGAVNECYLTQIATSPVWYGVYIGFNGTRLSGTGASAVNLDDVFDIRLMSSYDSFATLLNVGQYSNWNHSASTTGARMDRQFTGVMTIGGRGSNRNFPR